MIGVESGLTETMSGFLYKSLPQLDSLQFFLSEGRRAKGHGLGHIFTGLSSVLPRSGNVFRGRELHLSLPFDSNYGASRQEFLNILHEVLAHAQQDKEREYEGVSLLCGISVFSGLLTAASCSAFTANTHRGDARHPPLRIEISI